jgi:hypothetical protein
MRVSENSGYGCPGYERSYRGRLLYGIRELLRHSQISGRKVLIWVIDEHIQWLVDVSLPNEKTELILECEERIRDK